MSNASVLLPEPETPVIDVELAARNVDCHRLQVVLARVDDADHVVAARAPRAAGAHQRLQRHALARHVFAQAERLLVLAQRRVRCASAHAPSDPPACRPRPARRRRRRPRGRGRSPSRRCGSRRGCARSRSANGRLRAACAAPASAWRCRRSAARWSARRTGTACPSSPPAAAAHPPACGEKPGELRAAAPRRPTAWAPAGRGARSRGPHRRSAAARAITSRSSRNSAHASATVRSSTSATESWRAPRTMRTSRISAR